MGRGSAAGNVFRIQPPMCIEKKDVIKVVNNHKITETETKTNSMYPKMAKTAKMYNMNNIIFIPYISNLSRDLNLLMGYI